VEALRKRLDESSQYASVKRMEAAYHGQYDWRKLKAASKEFGFATLDVFDANYGSVKAYHAVIWRQVYALKIPASPSQEVA
jgi:hypothetical protein